MCIRDRDKCLRKLYVIVWQEDDLTDKLWHTAHLYDTLDKRLPTTVCGVCLARKDKADGTLFII